MLAAVDVCARAKPDVGGVCACDARRPEKPEACLKTTHAKAGEENRPPSPRIGWALAHAGGTGSGME